MKLHVVIQRFNVTAAWQTTLLRFFPNCSAPCLLIAMPRPSKVLNLALIIVLIAVHPSPVCSRAIANDKVTRSSSSSQSRSQGNNLTNPPPPSRPFIFPSRSSPNHPSKLILTHPEPLRHTPGFPPLRQSSRRARTKMRRSSCSRPTLSQTSRAQYCPYASWRIDSTAGMFDQVWVEGLS